MWSEAGLPKPDRLIANARYQRTLSEIYGYSSLHRAAHLVRADRLKKPARLRALLSELGNPQANFPCILVAGTKGKGSTAAMIASILGAAGLRTGRYTQPHLVSWRERTWVNGRYLSVDDTIRLFPHVRDAADRLEVRRPDLGRLTTFEIGTAFSLLWFAHAEVAAAVIEVGVGGRQDATNALEPVVSVITPVSYDHADVIGPEISDIAYEKAGIMRPGRPVIIGRQSDDAAPVLRAESSRLQAQAEWIGSNWTWSAIAKADPVVHAPEFSILGPEVILAGLQLPVIGDFQRENATAALAAVVRSGLVENDRLPQAARAGLSQLRWPGRVHVVRERPLVIFDGAHNAESARQLADTLKRSFGPRKRHWVIGMSRGKDVRGFLNEIREAASAVTVTTTSHDRSLTAQELAELAKTQFKESSPPITVAEAASPVAALSAALAQS
ncbi:MAG: bifunctional folylpolyglutamate synthase/dihydrofolate synthase, partial [Chloroflexota bacterium]